MLLMLALFIGTLAGTGTWLLLRARSFDAILGLTLLSYAVNLFIFASGFIRVNKPPLTLGEGVVNPADFADPLPQALVLTAIVIGFATTALYLVLMLGSRGVTRTDHVDGREDKE